MKKKIMIGSILTVFIMMLLPSVSAVEYNTAIKANESSILDEIRNINLEKLKVQLQSVSIGDIEKEFKDNPSASPLCFPIAGIVFYTLIAAILLYIIFNIVGIIVGAISGVVGTIARAIVGALCTMLGFIGKVIGLILSILGVVAGLAGKAIVGIIGFIGKVIGLILGIMVLIYNTIFPGFSLTS